MFDRPFRHRSREAMGARAREGAQRWAEEAGQAGSNLVDNTREFAAQALERAASRMRDLREGVADTASAAQRQMGQYADITRRYVADQPLRSALIAAAVGAALAWMVLAMRRRGGRY